MELDTEKIDDTALGLVYLTRHENMRAWKSMDWHAMGRLHEKGLIHNPVGKAKSIAFTSGAIPLARSLTTRWARSLGPRCQAAGSCQFSSLYA
jgi:hypothetical protein